MAIIDELALSKGGGIISMKQQAEQAENTVSIIIGLGGTGIDCIREIKTQVYSRILSDGGKDDTIAKYRHIKFIGVDADNANVGVQDEDDNKKKSETLNLSETEKFNLAGTDVAVAKKKGTNKIHPEWHWVSDKLETMALKGAGAGGCRQVGRFLLMNLSEKFMRTLRTKIDDAKIGLTNPEIAVHIFSGMGGGTGSGTFLDICYMVREVLKTENNAYISGYFFLPDVNVAHVKSPDVKKYIPINGYAAMQELDYCMNIESNKGKFSQLYGNGRRIDWDVAPVDFCHLISATDENGNVKQNAYHYAMKVTCEYVLEFLIKTPTQQFDMKSHLDNVVSMFPARESERRRGYNVRYLTIGASSASIPMKEINTFLATQIFNCFDEKCNDFPDESDVINFSVDVFGATPGTEDILTRIFNSLYSNVCGEAKQDYQRFNSTPALLKKDGNEEMFYHYENQTSLKKGILMKNCGGLLDSGNREALITKLDTIMKESVIGNIELGPVFGYNILNGAREYSMDNILDGLIAANSSCLKGSEQYTDGKRANLSKAQKEWEDYITKSLQNPKTLNKLYKEYDRSKYDLEHHYYIIESYKAMDDVLRVFKEQVGEKSDKYYLPLKNKFVDLRDTFKDNSKILEAGIIVDAIKGFDNALIDIKDPKMEAALNKELQKTTPDIVFKKLVKSFGEDTKKWDNNVLLTKLVTDFFVGPDTGIFKDFANNTLENFLEIVYGTEDKTIISEKIQEKWYGVLQNLAAPMFQKNDDVYPSEIGKKGRLTVPLGVISVLNAAEEFKGDKDDLDIGQAGKDRIFFMYSGLGFPISAMKKLEELEKEYYKAPRTGSHYYVGMPDAIDIDFDDWRKLPLLTPISKLEDEIERYPEIAQQNFQLYKNVYDKIIDYKLFNVDRISMTLQMFDLKEELISEVDSTNKKIVQFVNSYRIGENNDKYSDDKFKEALKNTLDSKDVSVETKRKFINDLHVISEKINKLIYIFNNKENEYYKNSSYELEIKGQLLDENSVEILTLDTLAYSPVVIFSCKNSIDILDRMQEIISMKDDIDVILGESGEADKRKGRKDFFEAVFCGIIKINNRKVTVTPEEDGIKEETIDLCDTDDDLYPFNTIAIYQAFENYFKLDNDIKNMIRDMKNNILGQSSAEIKQIAIDSELVDKFSSKKVNKYIEIVKTEEEYESIKDDAIQFFKDLKKKFDGWRIDYDIDAE